MKKLNDLLVKRSDNIGKMDAILAKAEKENRKRNETEVSEWNALDTEVRELSDEIKTLQRQTALNAEIAGSEAISKEESEAKKRFNLSKAILQASNGTLDGLEREMNDEGKKELSRVSGVVGNLLIPAFMISRAYTRANEETKSAGVTAGHIPTFVNPLEMGLVVPAPLYREMGVTVYENLQAGKLDLPFSKGHTASLVAEGSGATQSVPTRTKGTLSAGRFQGWQTYSQEYLAESAVMGGMLADMIGAIDRSIGKALLLDAIATSVMAGFATSDTGTALTYTTLLDIVKALETEGFMSEGFIASKEIFYKLATTEKATNTAQFIVDMIKSSNRGSITGIPAFGTSFLPLHDATKYDVLFGDMKQLYVGLWGGVQLLVDPFSASDSGYVKISFSRMGAVDTNPYAVASKRNVI